MLSHSIYDQYCESYLSILLQYLSPFCSDAEILFDCGQLCPQGLMCFLQFDELILLLSQGTVGFSQGHFSMSLKDIEIRNHNMKYHNISH